MPDDCLVATGRRQRQFNRVCYVLGPHVGAKLPGDDVAAVVIQDRVQIIPAPANDLEVGEVGLPHLVDGCVFVVELLRRFDGDIIRGRDQISSPENAIS